MTRFTNLSRSLIFLLILLALPLLSCETLLGADEPAQVFEEAVEVTVEAVPLEATAVEEATTPAEQAPTADPETVTEESAPTEPAPTETAEPADRPLPQSSGPVGMTRQNPYPTTELVQAPNWDIQVLEVVRGDEAVQMVMDANQYNDPPPSSMEYVLVLVHATSTYEDNSSHEISDFDFALTGDRLIRYDPAFVFDLEPVLDAELLPGGESEGWLAFPVSIDEGNTILIFDEWISFDEDNERYIALEEGAAVRTPGDLADYTPNELGTSRDNPAAIGETAITERWAVTLLEVVRGQEALDMIMAANEFNSPPEEGVEYILARVQARNISSDEEAEWIDSGNFEVAGELNEVYSSPYFTTPDPMLDWQAYPGAELEGWVALQATDGEGGLVMIFDSFYDFSDTSMRYFAME